MAEGGFVSTRSHAQSARIVRLCRRPSRVRRTHSHAVCAAVSAQPLPARVAEYPFLLGWPAWESASMIFGRACGSGERPLQLLPRNYLKLPNRRGASLLLPVAPSACK